MPETPGSAARNIVLVHGGFVDGSGWEAVYKTLRRDGLTVSIVQNPTISLADDVNATRRLVAAQNGPVILAGHSYGGAVITEAGNDPKVVGLVYTAAFAPDKGESVSTLIKDPRGKSRDLRFPARRGGRAHHEGIQRHDGHGALGLGAPAAGRAHS